MVFHCVLNVRLNLSHQELSEKNSALDEAVKVRTVCAHSNVIHHVC